MSNPIQENSSSIKEEMVKRLMYYKNNPGLIINTLYDGLFTLSDEKFEVLSTNSPFDFLMESVAMTASTLHDAHEITYRQQYPRLATKYSELYNHMFDEHYIGRFATPGRVKFDISFKLDEILTQLDTTEVNGVSRLIFPRGSMILAKDYTFTFLYPIVITRLAHGGIQVLYNTDDVDPVQPLESNILDWDYTTLNGEDYLRIQPWLEQVTLTTYTDTLTQNYGYTKEYLLKDKFVHCRVYQIMDDGTETEIKTTHSDLVYDSHVVTARLTYLEDKLTLHIPPIYFNKGKTGLNVRVEIYTSLGQVEEPINEASTDSFSYQWDKLSNVILDSEYVAPIEDLSAPIILARTMLQGGTDGETFEETRDRVINFTSYTKVAITPAQLKRTLTQKGYDILKSRDTITARSYYATKPLPVSRYDNFTTGAAASMETIKISLKDLAKHPHVRDNGKRLTITPSVLFKINAGIVSLVYPEAVPDINKLGIEAYVGEINSLEYMYTPFYYVADASKNEFGFRAYYLDSPTLENPRFIANNGSSQMSVSSDEVVILRYSDRHGEGYKIRVKTRSTENYKKMDPHNLFCQLAISPFGEEKTYASINGKILGLVENHEDETTDIVFEFTLKTDWDITSRHGIIFKDFYMFINEPRKFEFPLNCRLHFIYGIQNEIIPDFSPNAVDKMINREILNSDIIAGITHDAIDCHFGQHLQNFWTNGIAVQGQKKYKRYQENIPRVYSSNVYEVDEEGIFVVEDSQLKIKHHAGDPVLDEAGQPILLHRQGDVMVDSQGLPVVEDEGDRHLVRMMDILMIDGIYYFATDENDMNYRNTIGSTLRDYIVNDLKEISGRLLENTRLYFYPKRTMGEARILVDNGTEIQIPMRLSFKVTYFLNEATYNNFDLRKAITNMTHEVINDHLTRERVSRSDIIADLRAKAGEGTLAVDLEKFGPNKDLTVFTAKDGSMRTSVKRLLKLQADKTLKVSEDIDVSFVKHDIIEETKA